MDFPLTRRPLYHIVLACRSTQEGAVAENPQWLENSWTDPNNMDNLADLHTKDRRPVRDHKEGKAMRLRVADGRGELRLEFPEHASVNVGQALQSVKDKSPEAYKRWCDSQGHLRSSLAIFVNGEHIRYRRGMKTELSDGDELYIIPMIAGG